MERHNPRAFSVANIRRTQKTVQRNLDRAQRCVSCMLVWIVGALVSHGRASVNQRERMPCADPLNPIIARSSIHPPKNKMYRKEHVPLVDRAEELPPPSLVVVMGPKGCGKSTLIRSLVKYYTGQNLSGASFLVT